MSKIFRKEMIESDIRKILSDALRELKNENLPKELFSFTRVTLSKDKRYADIYVSILPPSKGEETRESLFDQFAKYKGYFRKFLAQNTRMYTVPELKMILDKGIEQSVRMQQLLDSLHSSDSMDQES